MSVNASALQVAAAAMAADINIELEVTRGIELVSFPSFGYESLVVTEDLN